MILTSLKPINTLIPYFRISAFPYFCTKSSHDLWRLIFRMTFCTQTLTPPCPANTSTRQTINHIRPYSTHTGKCPNHRPVFSPTLRAPVSERLCYSQSIMDSRRNSFGHPKKFFLFTSHRNLSTHLRTHDFFKI